MGTVSTSVRRGRYRIEAAAREIGADLLVAIWGGTRPHIGAVGIAQPRPSLADPKRWSATSSNFTFVGHKEDLLSKEISERLAAALRRHVVVTVGIHWDHLGREDLVVVQQLVRELAEKLVAKVGAQPRRVPSTRRSREKKQ